METVPIIVNGCTCLRSANSAYLIVICWEWFQEFFSNGPRKIDLEGLGVLGSIGLRTIEDCLGFGI